MYIMFCNVFNYQNFMGYFSDGRIYLIFGNWEILEECFKVFDMEILKGKIYIVDQIRQVLNGICNNEI